MNCSTPFRILFVWTVLLSALVHITTAQYAPAPVTPTVGPSCASGKADSQTPVNFVVARCFLTRFSQSFMPRSLLCPAGSPGTLAVVGNGLAEAVADTGSVSFFFFFSFSSSSPSPLLSPPS